MSKSSKKSIDSVYPFAEHHRVLAEHGLIDFAYSNRIGNRKKELIKSTWKTWAGVIKHKENFSWGKVPPHQARELSRAGYLVKDGVVFVRKRGATKIEIGDGYVKYDFPDRVETRYLAQGSKWFDVIDDLQNRKLAKNEMLGLSIGDNSPFNTRFNSLKDAIGYMRHVLVIKEGFNPMFISLTKIKNRGTNGKTKKAGRKTNRNNRR